jgi:hypothetical protein
VKQQLAGMAETIKALGFATVQMVVGSVVGRALDAGISQVATIADNNLLRTLVQFSVGVPLLGVSMMVTTGGYVQDSPIGDAALVYWFYSGQPGLAAAVDGLETQAWADLQFLFSNGGSGGASASDVRLGAKNMRFQ